MQFNSFIFILLFLPVTVVLYFLANRINTILGKWSILVSSVIFYGYNNCKLLCIVALSIFVNYACTIVIKKYRYIKHIPLVAIPITIHIILLLYFKYLNFFISNINHIFSKDIVLGKIILPLGISFFTFQQIAYVVALSKGDIKDNNIIDYIILYLFFIFQRS